MGDRGLLMREHEDAGKGMVELLGQPMFCASALQERLMM